MTIDTRSYKFYLHFIASIPFVLFIVKFAFLTVDSRLQWFYNDYLRCTWEVVGFNIILFIQILIYLFLSYQLLIKYSKNYESTNKFDAGVDIKKIKTYLLVNLVYVNVSIPLCFYFNNELTNISVGLVAMDLQFLFLVFNLFFHKDKVTNNVTLHCDLATNTDKIINQKPKADAHVFEYENCLQIIIDYIEQHKSYLDENCSIQSISIETGLAVHHISTCLNMKLNKNFPDFINEYRIQLAKEILNTISLQSNTIESISAQCGFGSKSTFNRAFKKFTNNLTPTEYIRQQNNTL